MMKQTLKNKIIMPLVLFTGLSLAACNTTQKGKAFGDFIGHTMADEFVRGEIKSFQGHRDYRQERNVYQGSGQKQIYNEYRKMRKNIKELFIKDYITVEEYKKIILKIDLETLRKSGRINKEQYKKYNEAFEKGELK